MSIRNFLNASLAGRAPALATAFALALLAPPWAHAQTPAAKPPASAFFSQPEIAAAELSPNSRWLGVLSPQPENGYLRLIIIDQEGREPSRVVAQFSNFHIFEFQWVNDDLLLLHAAKDLADATKGSRGNQYYGLMSVQRDGEKMRLLIKPQYDSVIPALGNAPLEPNHRFLALGPPGSDQIVVGEYHWSPAKDLPTVQPLLLNARNGLRKSLNKTDAPSATGWRFDHLGQARMAWSRVDDQVTWHWQDLASGQWKSIATYKALRAPYTPEFVDADGNLYVTVTDASGTGEEMRRFDFSTGKPAREATVATPGYDGSLDGIVDRANGRLLGFSVRTDARQHVWLDGAMQALQQRIDAKLPGRANLFKCTDCSKAERILVFSYADGVEGDYLIFTPKTDQWQRVGLVRPALAGVPQGSVSLHQVKARDGLEFPLWVTRPAGAKGPQPAVVMVHGGPWSRGAEWKWDPEAQFLASRGYVVLEPEFRGSTGYGDKLYRAGFKQWGLAMQDDVADALQHAVKQGWVDPKRVCIAGASYGGYATLMGLAKHPELYRCGVAWVGVSDIDMMFSAYWSDVSDLGKRHEMREVIGDPEKDAALFKANSPVHQAARIKAPVFLAYGSQDRRVPIEHGERMRAALTREGRPPEWVVYTGEGHGWGKLENKIDFWTRFEKFLGQHLAP